MLKGQKLVEQLIKLDNEYKKRPDLIKKSYDDGLITFSEYMTCLYVLAKEYQKQKMLIVKEKLFYK